MHIIQTIKCEALEKIFVKQKLDKLIVITKGEDAGDDIRRGKIRKIFTMCESAEKCCKMSQLISVKN